MQVFDYSWHEKQCIKVLSSLSSSSFGFRSFPDSVTDTIKVRNIQESKRYNALNDMNNHKPNAFKPFKPLLRASQFPRFRNRGYQSQEYSRKQEGTNLQGYRVCFFLILNIYYLCDLSVAEFFFSPMVSCFHLLLHEALSCMQAPALRNVCIIQSDLKWWNWFKINIALKYCFGTFVHCDNWLGRRK